MSLFEITSKSNLKLKFLVFVVYISSKFLDIGFIVKMYINPMVWVNGIGYSMLRVGGSKQYGTWLRMC